MPRENRILPFQNVIARLKKWDELLFIAVLAAGLWGYWAMHQKAGYTLPVPWPDEAHFLWQANGFAEHFTLFAPEINADRTVFWMPPGYFLALGVIVKLFGLSLGVARTFSFLAMLASLILLAVILRRYALPLLSLLLVIAFFLGAPAVACGNIARMEALLIFMILVAFLLLQRGKHRSALCLLALTPLIHPNGLYFLITVSIVSLFAFSRPLTLRRPSRSTLISLAVVLLPWLAYGIYALLNWDLFVQDMSFQFGRKANRDLFGAVYTPDSMALLIAVLLGAIYCYCEKLKVVFLLAIAVPAWWTAAAGIEMWYRVFFTLSYACFSVFFLNIALHMARASTGVYSKIVVPVSVAVVLIAAVLWNVRTGYIETFADYPSGVKWYDMKFPVTPYITDEDIRIVGQRLWSIPRRSEQTVIQFYPTADAFFFLDHRSDKVLFNCPLFFQRRPDWYVIHLSGQFPPAFNKYTLAEFHAAGLDENTAPPYLCQLRDGTEQWYLVPAKAKQ